MEPRNSLSPRGRPTKGIAISQVPSGAYSRDRTPDRIVRNSYANPNCVSMPTVPEILTTKEVGNVHERSASDRSFDRSDLSLPAESDSDAISLHSTMSQSAVPLSWVYTTVGDLVSKEKLISVDMHVSVEYAFDIARKNDLTCVPLSRNGVIFDYFDYADLTGYLLLVLGHITVKGDQNPDFARLLKQARQGIPAPVEFASQFGGGRDPFVRMSSHTTLVAAVEKFASGVHRIAVTSSSTSEVIGILSQRRIIRYAWQNLNKFPSLEANLDSPLDELHIGTYGEVVTISGDAPVLDALDIMHERAVSSVAVVDAQNNLLGNISVVDVSLLTRAWQAGLLRESCRSFLTVILDHRGLAEGGNESVPVFYVYPHTSLAKVLATLVATNAHRLWICEPTSDTLLSGRLIGVVSLTDILNFIIRQSGQTLDPETARRHRRSSSSSVRSSSSRSNSRAKRFILEGGHSFDRPRLSFDRSRQ